MQLKIEGLEISESELDLVVGNKEKTLVKFGANWCGPCNTMDKVLNKVIEDGYKRVVKVDIEKSIDIALKFKIRKMPTFMIFKEGEILERFDGAVSKKVLIEKMK